MATSRCDGSAGNAPLLQRLEELKLDIEQIATAQKRVESLVQEIHGNFNTVVRPSLFWKSERSEVDRGESAFRNESLNQSSQAVSFVENSPRTKGKLSTSYGSEGSQDDRPLNEDNCRPSLHGIRERRGTTLKQREQLRTKTDQRSATSVHLGFMSAAFSHQASSTPTRTCRPVHPDSSRRIVFDLTMVLVLIYDSIMIPYQLAWTVPFDGWVVAATWATFLFWLSDLMLGFLTGFRSNGKLVMDFPRICRRYLATYFFPNLMLVGADLAGIVIEMTADGGAAGETAMLVKSARIIKLNRMLRLAAMFRTGQIAQLYDRVLAAMRKRGMAEQMDILVKSIKLVILIIWVNHMGGCVWHLIGSTAREEWFLSNGIANSASLEYLLAFYWSTSAMIAGESIMVPTEGYEMLCTICYVLFGFIFSSVLISSLATTLINFQMANKEQQERLNTLRQFLYQHQVTSTLCVPIEKQVLARTSSVKRLCQKDVSALSLLSPLMRTELFHAIYGPSISSLLFNAISAEVDASFVKDICFNVLLHEAHEPGDRIFRPCDTAVGARFVYWGTLEYLHASGPVSGSASFSEQAVVEKPESVNRGQWVSEISLWSRWKHRGWMDTTAPCELLAVPADAFVEVIMSRPEIAMMAQDYSAALIQANSRKPEDALSDLALATCHEAVLLQMHRLPRKLMSLAALSAFEVGKSRSARLHETELCELRREVEEEESDIVMCPGDRAYRLVVTVYLRLSVQDSWILVQLGKWDDAGVASPDCRLPQLQMTVGEPPRTALDRLVASKMPFVPKAEVDRSIEQELVLDEEKATGSGFLTKHARIFFDAVVESEFKLAVSYLDRKPTGPVERDTSAPCRHAFAVADSAAPEKRTIYTWISPTTFDALTTSQAGEVMAQRFLSELVLDGTKVNLIPPAVIPI